MIWVEIILGIVAYSLSYYVFTLYERRYRIKQTQEEKIIENMYWYQEQLDKDIAKGQAYIDHGFEKLKKEFKVHI